MSVVSEKFDNFFIFLDTYFDAITEGVIWLYLFCGVFFLASGITTYLLRKDRNLAKILSAMSLHTSGVLLTPVVTFYGILYFTNYTKTKSFFIVFFCLFIKRILSDIFSVFTKKEVQ